MKRTLIALIATCSIATTAYSQNFSHYELILEGGALAQTFSGVPDDVMVDGAVGVRGALTLRIGDPFYIEPGIGAAATAYDVTATVTDGGVEEDVTDELGHVGIRVPVRFGLRFLPGSFFGLRIFGGVAPTFVTTVEEDNDFEITKDDYKSSFWTGEIGVGADAAFLTLNVVYEAGLSSLFEDGAASEESSDIKLSGLGASLGLRFNL